MTDRDPNIRCQNCFSWNAKGYRHIEGMTFQCRRNPPQVFHDPVQKEVTRWPTTHSHDWCMDFCGSWPQEETDDD
jgi:hypothetical protein